MVGTVDASSTTPLSRAYYTAWGEPTWSTTAPALGFQGQYTDPGTGFVDMTTRNYVPSLGRFASQDIVFGGLRHPLSLNQCIYGNDDPVSGWDPSGRTFLRGTGGGYGGGGAAVVAILATLSSTEAAVIGSTILVGGYVVACGQVVETLTPAVEVFLQRTFHAEGGSIGAENEAVLDILAPGGELLGGEGKRCDVRTLDTAEEIEDVFQQLAPLGEDVTPDALAEIGGTRIDLPDGGYIAYRPTSRSGGPTIDVRIPQLPQLGGIHLPDGGP